MWHLTMLIVVFSVCHGDLVPAQCMLTLVFESLKQSLESLLLDLHSRLAKSTNSLIMAIESS